MDIALTVLFFIGFMIIFILIFILKNDISELRLELRLLKEDVELLDLYQEIDNDQVIEKNGILHKKNSKV